MRGFICLILAASFLSGCGIKGELETPPPIWGSKKDSKPVPPAQTDTDEADDSSF
ncbi:MAG: LPS translocon maturation chaperone LptM [Maricaulaceae bacterium]